MTHDFRQVTPEEKDKIASKLKMIYGHPPGFMGTKYRICTKCGLVVYLQDGKFWTSYVSTKNKTTHLPSCDEFIIQGIIE